MKKVIAVMLIACLSLSCLGMSSFASDKKETIQDQASKYIEKWFNDNFSEHYKLSDYQSSIKDFSYDGDSIFAKVSIGATTTLKYDSVEDLPYMQGLKNKLNVSSLAEVVPSEYAGNLSKKASKELKKSVEKANSMNDKKVSSRLSVDINSDSIMTQDKAAKNIIDNIDNSISKAQANNLVRLIADKYVDAADCIGEGTLLTMELVFKATYADGKFSKVSLCDADTLEDANNFIPLAAKEMKDKGVTDINEFLYSKESQKQKTSETSLSTNQEIESMQLKQTNQTINFTPNYYYSYNRVNARNYAWEHTYPGYASSGSGVSASNYCSHGSDDGALVDRSYWNNEGSPYSVNACLNAGHCHNDCACFVSQCMVAGGLPTDNSWYYLGPSWSSCDNLLTYMTEEYSSHKYWEPSNFTSCNAGNIAFWSWGHITLVTLNDTITHRYTAHTNDTNNRTFSSSTMVGYYTINPY